MNSGASSPEELESLMEDAFVASDHTALVEMFGEELFTLLNLESPIEGSGL
jgi:hypothetical protein